MLAADDGARLIAGGQTLVPLMAMRLARPTRLIDIARIPGLAYRPRTRAIVVAIGATTRQHVIESDPVVRDQAAAARQGHALSSATARRGRAARSAARSPTAIAAAEIVLVAVTLGATLIWREDGADHAMPAADFFLGPMVTALPLAACLSRGALSGVAGAAGRRGLPRGQRAAERFCLRVGRGADRARCRGPLHARGDRHRCGDGRAAAARCGGRALEGPALRRSQGARRRARRRWPTSRRMADLHASADYRRRVAVTLAVRAIADAYRMPPRGAHEGRARHQQADSTRSRSSRARACSTACATSSCSPARMPAASTASAAPARCWSTARRCAPA